MLVAVALNGAVAPHPTKITLTLVRFDAHAVDAALMADWLTLVGPAEASFMFNKISLEHLRHKQKTKTEKLRQTSQRMC